jgi:hypothetical protein
MKKKLLFSSAIAFITMFGSSATFGDLSTMSLDFEDRGWREKRLARSPTRYILVEENGQDVLLALSWNSASAYWTPLEMELSGNTWLSWRWKVSRGLSGDADETNKAGDDYPARVLVAFDPNPFSKSTRALCYVWANDQPKGSVYENPYSGNVATIVVRSGDRGVGEWFAESRNVVADYRLAFGESPSKIYALAVMVDTDNTSSQATAWFADMALVSKDWDMESGR